VPKLNFELNGGMVSRFWSLWHDFSCPWPCL